MHKVVAYMSSLVWICSGLSEALSEALSMLLAEGLAKTSLNPPVDYSDPWQRIWQKTLERCEFRVWLHPLPTSMNRNLYSGDFFMTHAGSTVTRRTVLSKSSQAIFTVVVSCSNSKINKRKNSIVIVAVTVNKSTPRINGKNSNTPQPETPRPSPRLRQPCLLEAVPRRFKAQWTQALRYESGRGYMGV